MQRALFAQGKRDGLPLIDSHLQASSFASTVTVTSSASSAWEGTASPKKAECSSAALSSSSTRSPFASAARTAAAGAKRDGGAQLSGYEDSCYGAGSVARASAALAECGSSLRHPSSAFGSERSGVGVPAELAPAGFPDESNRGAPPALSALLVRASTTHAHCDGREQMNHFSAYSWRQTLLSEPDSCLLFPPANRWHRTALGTAAREAPRTEAATAQRQRQRPLRGQGRGRSGAGIGGSPSWAARGTQGRDSSASRGCSGASFAPSA